MRKVLEAVFAKHKEVEQTYRSEFTELAQKIAEGGEPDPAKVVVILRDAGKTPTDLASAVDLAEKRIDWKRELGAREQAEAVIATTTAAMERLEAEFLKVRQAHEVKIDTLKAKKAEAVTITNRAQDAEMNLHRTAPAPVKEVVKAIDQRAHEIAAERDRVRRLLETAKAAAAEHRVAPVNGEPSNWRELFAEYTARAEAHKATLAKLEVQERALLKDRESAERALHVA